MYNPLVPQASTTMSLTKLTKYARSTNEYTRADAASNWSITPGLAMNMTEDPAQVVRFALASNRSPQLAGVLRELSWDKDTLVLAMVARNPYTPMNDLIRLAESRRFYGADAASTIQFLKNKALVAA